MQCTDTSVKGGNVSIRLNAEQWRVKWIQLMHF